MITKKILFKLADGFDIVVNDCYAHNGGNKKIQLIDQYGCPVDDKLISRFRGSWSESGLFETQVFAYMKTFRFTGSPALYIECDVRMCHGRCPVNYIIIFSIFYFLIIHYIFERIIFFFIIINNKKIFQINSLKEYYAIFICIL